MHCLALALIFAMQPPVPQTAEPPVTVEGLAAQLAQVRLQKLDVEKRETALIAEITRALRAQLELLAKLGIKIDGVPTPPPDAPPAPPAPPTPPAPTDAFTADLRGLVPVPANAELKQRIALVGAVYRLAATEAMDPANATFADLLDLIAAAFAEIDKGSTKPLLKIRERVRAELIATAPNLDIDLTDAVRKAIADVYRRAAAALAGDAK